MRWPVIGRAFLGATSVIVTVGLVMQLVLSVTADADTGYFVSTPDRIVNFFSFFTVLSNVTVAVTTGMLAADPDRRSTLFRVLRLDGVLAIAVTGVVFHLALSDLQELTGWNAFADFVLHTLSPILAVAGWVLFGPRGHLSPRVVALSVVAPVLWLADTLVRGTLVQDRFGDDYYPYPFMDVQEHGYPVVLVNCAVVAVLFLALAYGALLLDRRLRRGGAGAPAPQTPPA